MTTQTKLSATELNPEFNDWVEMLSEWYDNAFSNEQELNVLKGWARGLIVMHDHNSIIYCNPQPYNSSAERREISCSTFPELNALNPILSIKDRSW